MAIKQFYYKSNRLQQLKGFYYTVQKGGVKKAADHMGLTSSTISIQIKSLERDLKVKLFQSDPKDKRMIILTKDGELLYEMAVPLIQGMDSIYEEFMIERNIREESRIDISAIHICQLYIIPKIMHKFWQIHPGYKANLRNISKNDAIDRILNNETDIAIYATTDIPEELEFKHIAYFDPIVLFKKNHPLAQLDKITMKDIAKYNLMRIDPHLITLPRFEDVILHYNIKYNTTFENGDWEILKNHVREDNGIAMLSNICITPRDKDLVFVSLNDYFPRISYGIIWKKGRRLSPQMKDFIQISSTTNFFK